VVQRAHRQHAKRGTALDRNPCNGAHGAIATGDHEHIAARRRLACTARDVERVRNPLHTHARAAVRKQRLQLCARFGVGRLPGPAVDDDADATALCFRIGGIRHLAVMHASRVPLRA
jgi:hypothetical protein